MSRSILGGDAVAAVVLAAGFSSRMGAFKPLLPFGSTTVVGHVIANLRTAGISPIVVVGGHRAEELRAGLAGLDVVVAHNPDYPQGMYTSLVTGIWALPDTVAASLVLPVDVPLVRAGTFSRIARIGRRLIAGSGQGSAPAVVHPVFDGVRGHPPLVGRALFPAILAGSGEGGLAALLGRYEDRTAEVAVFDRGTLFDMDRPDDHVRLMARLARRRVPEAEECEAILDRLAVDETVRDHCRAVAELALSITACLVEAGAALDIDLVCAGGVLHDLAKGRLHHAELAARYLAREGFPELARVVAAHMELPFVDGDPIDEAVVVHLADKLIRGERRVSLDERFSTAIRRWRDDPVVYAAIRRRQAAVAAMARAVERVAPGVLGADFRCPEAGRSLA